MYIYSECELMDAFYSMCGKLTGKQQILLKYLLCGGLLTKEQKIKYSLSAMLAMFGETMVDDMAAIIQSIIKPKKQGYGFKCIAAAYINWDKDIIEIEISEAMRDYFRLGYDWQENKLIIVAQPYEE